MNAEIVLPALLLLLPGSAAPKPSSECPDDAPRVLQARAEGVVVQRAGDAAGPAAGTGNRLFFMLGPDNAPCVRAFTSATR